MIRIKCRNNGEIKEFPEGTSLLEMVDGFNFEKPYPILSAKVNFVGQGLKYRAYNNREVEFLDYRTYAGRSVYCRSLCFLLSKAARDIFPECRILMRRPISKGYFCSLDKGDGSSVTRDDVLRIEARMREIVAEDVPFHRHEVTAEEAIEIFRKMNYMDKVRLIESVGQVYVFYYTLGGTPDYYYDALLPSASFLNVWELSLFKSGMLLRIPDRHHPENLAPCVEQPKTYEVLKETLRWNAIMDLENAGDVNVACHQGKASDLIQISEALQEKKIVQIAEEIDRRTKLPDPVRLVLITGPTSSGKSTFCKRLSIQLKACGLHPISFSTDDYFVNRLETPLLPDGSFDFDNFETVDHDYLQKDVLKLLSGEAVEVPHFNFVTGLREFVGKKLKLEGNSILLIEGIHALNPRLTDMVPENNKYKIFINTMTSISLDDHNCIPTSDNRLLRRIVRDYNNGSFSAVETISHWPNVRRSEGVWIYPFQENADVFFNSSLLVEFAVLRSHAEQILATVPKNVPEYSEAHRLLKFLSYFTYVSDKDVPPTSLLRGFIGGSSL